MHIFLFYFQCDLIYNNGVKVNKKLNQQLLMISGDTTFDRTFVNAQFLIVLTEKYIFKKIKKGFSREEILKICRESNRYDIMRLMYEYRVLFNGQGDLKDRCANFKNIFRVKFNNWWPANFAKKNKSSKT